MKPPEALRAIPLRGTPPVARQSRFHGGTGVGRALVRGFRDAQPLSGP